MLRFHPPLVIHNFLPCPITVTLHDNRAGGQHFQQQREAITFSMSTGGYQEIYQLDMSRRIKMSVQMQVSSANGTSPSAIGLPSVCGTAMICKSAS